MVGNLQSINQFPNGSVRIGTGSFILEWIISFANSKHFGTDNHYIFRFKIFLREGHLMKWCQFSDTIHHKIVISIFLLLFYSHFIVRVWKWKVPFCQKSVSCSKIWKVIWIFAADYQMPISKEHFKTEIFNLSIRFVLILPNWNYPICAERPCSKTFPFCKTWYWNDNFVGKEEVGEVVAQPMSILWKDLIFFE